MFEKDLYALIRGLRNHKGNEREYIQNSIKECRKEIRGSDMDQKATALLKLIYLEMFGHDMSWASFHVLEVMSSQKYLQKRVGYLGAVQSFRPDTEVLMLGENLLKKDLASSHPITIHLPLVTIPHVINPSMANSLLADLLPRVSHSHASIRKKTIVTLYRLALVYPETLRPTWPKIKERLLDENEDPSVTAAIVNVVCELGWRRPHDFLPLAPRLFDLLVQGGNNWMAIKIIKLFAILTPLEPRLVKKLLPPLTTLIKTTPAMSLLYECINGIIQGGILDGSEGTVEGDEIARLCVSKLRGMLVVEGDPNLKYVALLALAKIVDSHPQLVSQHADVILECIDDPDISIRTRSLDLIVGMVDSNNLVPIVERLLRQLRESAPIQPAKEPENDRGFHEGIMPTADADDEGATETLRKHEHNSDQIPPLPDVYRISVITKILDLCSRDTYANINDFEWYVGILVELVRHCPSTTGSGSEDISASSSKSTIADSIGHELQNIAVRVKAVRPEVTAAAQSLLLIERRKDIFPASGTAAHGVLGSAAWIAGEYASLLPDPDGVLSSLVHPSTLQLPSVVLSLYLQAIPKIFVRITSNHQSSWTPSLKSHTLLLTARVIHFLEPLVLHPNLEVQERAVEYLELMRLASDAASAQSTENDDGGFADGPLLLTQAIPALFTGMELNPVAAAALRKVPAEEGLDLSAPINESLQMLLQQADYDTDAFTDDENEAYKFYNEQPVSAVHQQVTAAELLGTPDTAPSYQNRSTPMDAEALERLKAERRQRYQDDPYYIDSERNSGTSTPLHNILRSSNGDELDIDSIPIMDLALDSSKDQANERETPRLRPAPRKPKKKVEIAADETIGGDEPTLSSSLPRSIVNKAKKSLLEVDSSALSSLSLSDESKQGGTQLDIERRQAEEEEMQKAMKEVERVRLEMQRAQERVADPEEGGMVVKRKKKKNPRVEDLDGGEKVADDDGNKVVKKKVKKKKPTTANGDEDEVLENDVQRGEEAEAKPKKKKKKRQVLLDDTVAEGET